MEAANRGATEAGAPSIGFNIRLPFEQEPNAFSTPDLTFLFHYFAMRKMHLAMRAAALVVFPGGFGTFDELFEILTLRQTGKAPAIPIVLFDRDYWTRVINFDVLADEGMIKPEDLALFAVRRNGGGSLGVPRLGADYPFGVRSRTRPEQIYISGAYVTGL